MLKLFSLAGGDDVHNTFRSVRDEGGLKQVYLFCYMIIFFTALSNIFVAVIMDGYEMSKIRKAIDNNNPFPSAQSAAKAVRDKKIEPTDKFDDDADDKPVSLQASPYFRANS